MYFSVGPHHQPPPGLLLTPPSTLSQRQLPKAQLGPNQEFSTVYCLRGQTTYLAFKASLLMIHLNSPDFPPTISHFPSTLGTDTLFIGPPSVNHSLRKVFILNNGPEMNLGAVHLVCLELDPNNFYMRLPNLMKSTGDRGKPFIDYYAGIEERVLSHIAERILFTCHFKP